MPRTRPDWFYWFMVAYTLPHLVWMVVLFWDFVSHPWAPDPTYGSPAYRLFIVLGLTPLSLTISFLVLRRTPGNVTGLCLLLWSALNLGQAVPANSPIAFMNGAYNTGWTGLWLLALYFPNGRAAPVRFERWIRLSSVFTVIMVGIWYFFQPTVNNWGAGDPARVVTPNPLFVPVLRPYQPLVNVLEASGLVSILAFILPSLWLRYQSSNEKEKTQLKWLAWTYGILIASLLFYVPSGLISGDPHKYGLPGLVAVAVFGLYVALAPFISIGSAILLHRLYNIDIVIRRTLVYSTLTVLLGLVYFGGVTVLQTLFTAASAQTSPAAVVLSTLLIAALFTPLRRRVQDFIDRRFYRRRYDAEKALAEFAAVARSHTDLRKLTNHLLDTVQSTLQPAGASVWLKATVKRQTGEPRENRQ